MPHRASSTAAGDIELASSDLARGPGSSRAVPSAADALRSFAADLFGTLQPGQDNLLCSPYSILAALAMTRNGARGTTADEMDEVLHAAPFADYNGGLNALTRHIEAIAGEQTRADGTSAELTLDVANSLWGQQGTTWEPAFLDTLAEHYGAGVRMVDFAGATEAARVLINGWVERRTHDRIMDLLAPGVLDNMTRLVLVNAIYLKAPWEVTFDAGQTRPRPFTRADGSTVQPETMSGMMRGLSYARGEGWQAARLPYAGGQLAMTVVVPDGRDTTQLEADLSGAGLHGILTTAKPASMLQLQLPKFGFRTSVALNEPLSATGDVDGVRPCRRGLHSDVGRARAVHPSGGPSGVHRC